MGEVSWPAFVSALRHPRLGQTGIAKKNATQHGKIKETVYFISLYIITSILCVYELLAAESGSGGGSVLAGICLSSAPPETGTNRHR